MSSDEQCLRPYLCLCLFLWWCRFLCLHLCP